MAAGKPKLFEPPLPSLLPPGKRVLLNGKPVPTGRHRPDSVTLQQSSAQDLR
jgi:hypothetical protein